MPPWEMLRMRSTKNQRQAHNSRNRMAANTKPSTIMIVSMAMVAPLLPFFPYCNVFSHSGALVPGA